MYNFWVVIYEEVELASLREKFREIFGFSTEGDHELTLQSAVGEFVRTVIETKAKPAQSPHTPQPALPGPATSGAGHQPQDLPPGWSMGYTHDGLRSEPFAKSVTPLSSPHGCRELCLRRPT